MGIQRRMLEWSEAGNLTRVAVVGAGFIGRGLVHQLSRFPGMTPVLVVNRTEEHAVAAYTAAGHPEADIVISDDPDELRDAIAAGRPAVASSPQILPDLAFVDVVVEATGAMDLGARTMLEALEAGKDVVSMNAEADALLGHLLHDTARRSEAVYTVSDGDQPGVLLRHLEFVAGMGFEIVAAVNCKRNLDIHQSPTDSKAYSNRDGTSLLMTTAFGDGTKMQIENAVVANMTGLVPDRRGMHGIETTLEHAAADVVKALSRDGVVEYTLGGDFGGGVGVIGRPEDPEVVAPYMRYSKMGDGPEYFFFRPYHLLHLETPVTIAEVILDREGLGRPSGPPVADVIAVAKKDLDVGETLDGIGGYACYGHIDSVDGASGLLPIGLAEHARVTRPVRRDEPVPLDSVELDDAADVVRLRRTQDELVASG